MLVYSFEHQLVSTFAMIDPVRNSCDSCSADAGVLRNSTIGDAGVDEPSYFPAVGKVFEFLEGGDVPEKSFTFINRF